MAEDHDRLFADLTLSPRSKYRSALQLAYGASRFAR